MGGSKSELPNVPMDIPMDSPKPATQAEPSNDVQPEDSSSEMSFGKEPFDAGVEADEDSDPKKFLQQLTGKIGQSLRNYNDKQDKPDLELEKFIINSILSATHTSQMDDEDKKDIVKKVESSGNGDNNNGDNENNVNDEPEKNKDIESNDEELSVSESLFLENPPKNNMFQPGSNNKLKESCWKAYEQIGMKDKNGKQVPNCVPVNENHDGGLKNYMFFQNLKTIVHASQEILNMDPKIVDETLSNGHDWASDHISTSSDDVEEVYHFLEHRMSDSNDIDDSEFGSSEVLGVYESENDDKPLNKVMRGDVKKFKVYVKNENGNVVKVNFGDPNMEIKRDDPERRKSFRARHNCDNPGPKTKARYWSCKMWSSKKVSDIVGENFENKEKSSIFAKKQILNMLKETFNDNTEVKPIEQPIVKPNVEPIIKPTRRERTFKPGILPEIAPKAENND